jgi:hypothetical protein
MADDTVTLDESIQPPADQWQTIVDQFMVGAAKHIDAKKSSGVITSGVAGALTAVLKILTDQARPIAQAGGEALVALEEPMLPIFAAFVAPIVANMFGSPADASLFASRGNVEGRSEASAALVDAFVSAIAGHAGGELQPGDEGAKRLAGAGVHAALEGWFNAWVLEMLGELIPFEWLKFKEMTALPEDITRALGIGRLVRRAIAPLVDATAATPMKWQANKTYRPNMLGDGDVVKAFLRGDYTADEAREELARAGYSERRIDMLIAAGLKQLSLDDLMVLQREGSIDDAFILATLRASGYDAPGAEYAKLAAYSKYLASIHDDSFAAVRGAYVDRRISDGEFEQFLEAIYPDDATRAAREVAARTMRDVNTRRLSSGQVEACVKAGVLAIVDYRVALEREGYPPEDVLALELLLETSIKAGADVEKLRAQKAADAKAAADAKDAADARKRADAEAAAALKRRGPVSELERAAVRGLIPIDRVAEVLRADYDADTVQIYLDDITAQRADYIANQKKAADAAARAQNKGLSIAQAERAVFDDVLTLDDYARLLSRAEIAPADQQILVATLRAEKADADAAKRKRADAAAKASAQHINLATFEQLVRAGIRPIADYDALLSTLGYNDADRASLGALLQQHIDADAAAKKLRDELAAKNAVRGLSLEQFRRAVVLDVKTLDEFQTWLVDQKYSVDAQAVLIAELQDDVTQADAARAKREAAASSSGAAGVPLSTVTRAARLGILTPAQYQTELVDRGFTADDIALELDLLSAEIANVKTAGALATSADDAAAGVGLTLAQIAAAVKAGEATLEEYSARASSLGLSDDDVATLTRVLADSLAATTAAKARRAQLESTVKPGDVALSVLEQQVRDGALTLDAFAGQLIAAGLSTVDVDLLTSLLSDEGA